MNRSAFHPSSSSCSGVMDSRDKRCGETFNPREGLVLLSRALHIRGSWPRRIAQQAEFEVSKERHGDEVQLRWEKMILGWEKKLEETQKKSHLGCCRRSQLFLTRAFSSPLRTSHAEFSITDNSCGPSRRSSPQWNVLAQTVLTINSASHPAARRLMKLLSMLRPRAKSTGLLSATPYIAVKHGNIFSDFHSHSRLPVVAAAPRTIVPANTL